MDKNERLAEDIKTIWALTILFICHEYDLKNFSDENQSKILFKSLLNTRAQFFEIVFVDFFFEQKK